MDIFEGTVFYFIVFFVLFSPILGSVPGFAFSTSRWHCSYMHCQRKYMMYVNVSECKMRRFSDLLQWINAPAAACAKDQHCRCDNERLAYGFR